LNPLLVILSGGAAHDARIIRAQESIRPLNKTPFGKHLFSIISPVFYLLYKY
jgi:hypothetical protein